MIVVDWKDELIRRGDAIRLPFHPERATPGRMVDSRMMAEIVFDNISQFIKNVPAVDAVEVVRCSNCRFAFFADNRAPEQQCWVCGKHGWDVYPDWFCADGQRKEVNHG